MYRLKVQFVTKSFQIKQDVNKNSNNSLKTQQLNKIPKKL